MITRIIGIAILIASIQVFADDLDDGIPLDTPINDDLTLGKNINFIKRNAIGKARSRAKDKGGNIDDIDESCEGTGNIKVGAGSNLKGATIVNLSNNKGTTSFCGK